MKREKFPARTYRLIGESQRRYAIEFLNWIPIDQYPNILITFSEEISSRKKDQNALYWSGPLKDIESQAYVNGRTYTSKIWHEHMKELFLPDQYSEEYTKKEYRKYDFTPHGERILVGSTTQLTIKGFAMYLEQVIAFGVNLGVQFGAKE